MPDSHTPVGTRFDVGGRSFLKPWFRRDRGSGPRPWLTVVDPFEQLRLSNSVTHPRNGDFGDDHGLLGIWRRKRDSNPRGPFDPNGFQERKPASLAVPSKTALSPLVNGLGHSGHLTCTPLYQPILAHILGSD
jgi:hypothetical protein